MIDLNEVRLDEAPGPDRLDPATESAETSAPGSMPEPAEANRANPGQLEEELSSMRRKYLNLAAERELALALSGEALIPGVSNQLLKLLKDRVVAEETADQGILVRSRDGRPVGEAVKEWLGSPEYRHFRSAGSRGGVLRKNESTMHSGASEFHLGSPGKSLNELVIERWKNRLRTTGKEGLWPRIS